MYLINAAKAAVGVSCLLLIIAYQPVKSCNCPSLTDEQPFCLDEDLLVVKLTVLEVTNTDSSSSDFFQYKVRIEEVFKSNNGLTAQTEMDLKTPRISELCALQLSSETRYLISVSVDDGVLSANGCSWMKEWVSEEDDVVQALLAEIPPNCEETE